MLKIHVEGGELYDEINEEFVNLKPQTLSLEHSLVSVSKWESKFCKPFITKQEKTYEETIEYVKCMTLTQNVDPLVYKFLSVENIEAINTYISSPMSATWFRKEAGGHSSEQVTSELIYYWMIALQIPFECQKWHLNRLLTLIKICEIKNQPAKKMSKSQIMSNNAAINAARRKKFNSKG